MDTLSYNDYKPVQLSDKPLLMDIFSRLDPLPCEYVFANLIMWGKIYDARYAIYKNALVIRTGLDKCLLMPVGNTFSPQELKDMLMAAFPDDKEDCTIIQVPDEYINQNIAVNDIFDIEKDIDFADYIYSTEKLYLLRGSKLAKKKNLLSQFTRNYPGYVCAPLETSVFEECSALAEKWCEDKTCKLIGITHEKSAMSEAFKLFRELELDGLYITVNGKIVAFSIFSFQNSETAVVHFEKYDKEFKGAAQAINWETAKYLLGRTKIINREQDIGLPGLRKAKQSYDPDKLLLNNILSLK